MQGSDEGAVDGVDPAVLMAARLQALGAEEVAEEKQARNGQASTLRAKRERDAREAVRVLSSNRTHNCSIAMEMEKGKECG